MVLLGIRPYEGFHFNLGRETFLVPFHWEEDGWPLLDSENGLVNSTERVPDLEEVIYPLPIPCDNFESSALGLMWNTIHPCKEPFFSLEARKGFLRLFLKKEVLHSICTPAFIGRRQQHKVFQALTAMEFEPCDTLQGEGEEAGIAAVQDDRFHYALVKTRINNSNLLRLYQTESGIRTLLDEKELEEDGRIYLSIQGSETDYRFYYGFQETERRPIGKPVKGSLLSSNTNEGFTGTYIGMYASSNGTETTNYADYDWFLYHGED